MWAGFLLVGIVMVVASTLGLSGKNVYAKWAIVLQEVCKGTRCRLGFRVWDFRFRTMSSFGFRV